MFRCVIWTGWAWLPDAFCLPNVCVELVRLTVAFGPLSCCSCQALSANAHGVLLLLLVVLLLPLLLL
jgi:hypothetical protein